jgi:hypothetical protein
LLGVCRRSLGEANSVVVVGSELCRHPGPALCEQAAQLIETALQCEESSGRLLNEASELTGLGINHHSAKAIGGWLQRG